MPGARFSSGLVYVREKEKGLKKRRFWITESALLIFVLIVLSHYNNKVSCMWRILWLLLDKLAASTVEKK